MRINARSPAFCRLHGGRCVGPAVVQEHQSDAGTYPEPPLVVEKSELFHAIADLLRQSPRLVCCAVLENHRELVAAQPREGVMLSNGFPE